MTAKKSPQRPHRGRRRRRESKSAPTTSPGDRPDGGRNVRA
ncbi:MAG: hypothetical protein ACFNUI_08395 [Negativicutes bacterium]